MGPFSNEQFTLHDLIVLNRKDEFLKRISSDNLDSVNSDGLTLLHTALKERNLEISTILIEKGADVNAKGFNGFTPLHYAILINVDLWEKDDDELIDIFPLLELLLKRGANVNELTEGGSTPLHFLIECYDYELDILKACKLFIENGAAVNVMDRHFKTPIFYAVDRESTELVKLLIENGADVNLGKYDSFPIIEANYKKESPDIVKLLLDNGADASVCEDEDSYETALSEQMFAGGNEQIVKMLLEKGADVNSLGLGEESPLHYAACYNLISTMKLIFEYKPTVNLKNYNGNTALHYAGTKGNFEAAVLLIQNGADINIKNNENQTAFHFAAVNNHISLVQYFLETGYDLGLEERNFILCDMIMQEEMNFEIADLLLGEDMDIKDLYREGKPLLYFALEEIDRRKVFYLLEKGADPESVPDWNSLSIYAVSGHTQKVKDLLKTGRAVFSLGVDDRDPINLAIQNQNRHIAKAVYKEAVKIGLPMKWDYFDNSLFYGNVYMASFFLKSGYTVKSKDDKSEPVIFSAVEGGYASSLKFLIKKGIGMKDTNRNGESAVYFAFKKGRVKIAALLLKAGFGLFDSNLISPFFWAARYGETGILNLLMKNIKDINALDRFGSAPLHYFAKESSCFHIKKLISHGANVHIKTKDGDTVIHLSVQKDDELNLEYFIQLGADVNVQNNAGDTALHIAVRKFNEKTVRILLKNGADASIKNNDQLTPLEMAYGRNLRIQGLLENSIQNQ
ncbi:MAG TPA: ankyrin repeat domain-containing protein [Leptospiraceae bacterium]|nr:ankyrin repeat domain-containing protein [Leptospiraceae bacterium]HMY65702.1 ankyrin repeat domain-containing protein [Leptospiraceae bacterium]HNF13363.1 ankyrin repeat domain-containing protein [Leptospiraceae bacterium]HNF23654.1 ankyrin repeat domain-containing protein [Leptospiraceae bacterium]HNI94737.1 ankyrin repeat domain-containing protein [Leptospiraceae bacterium]